MLTDHVSYRTTRDGREICDLSKAAGKREYYDRMMLLVLRQDHRCAICQRSFYGFRPTFDHQSGRGHGGAIRDDRIEIDGAWNNAALCYPCNQAKGSKRYSWQEVDGERRYLPVEKGEK